MIVCGFPFDFRLGYGRGINKQGDADRGEPVGARAARRTAGPTSRSRCTPATSSSRSPSASAASGAWTRAGSTTLREREAARDAEIAARRRRRASSSIRIHFFRALDEAMADDAVLVVDGGDFVATASYIVRPRAPLSWLDPGVFGTLGVGGGFALGASLVRPGSEVWLVWGDGSSAYTLAEFDTYVRHGVAPIAVIGNDASWMQIAREQVEVLGTSLGTDLRRSDYHKVAEGYGGVGLAAHRSGARRRDARRGQGDREGRPAGLHQRPPAHAPTSARCDGTSRRSRRRPTRLRRSSPCAASVDDPAASRRSRSRRRRELDCSARTPSPSTTMSAGSVRRRGDDTARTWPSASVSNAVDRGARCAARCRGRGSRRRPARPCRGRASSIGCAPGSTIVTCKPAPVQRLGHLEPDVAAADHDRARCAASTRRRRRGARCRRRSSGCRARRARRRREASGAIGVAPVAITSWSNGSTRSVAVVEIAHGDRARARGRWRRPRVRSCTSMPLRAVLLGRARDELRRRRRPRRRRSTGARTREYDV